MYMKSKSFKITSLKDTGDHAFWRRKSYVERLYALEEVRRIVFGYDPSAARLQRTITITQLKKG